MKLSKIFLSETTRSRAFIFGYLIYTIIKRSSTKVVQIMPLGFSIFWLYCDLWPFPQVSDPGPSRPSCLVMRRTKFKNENEQRAITPKVWSFELWFFCTALLLNEIYLPIKFHVDALNSFKVMLRTKKGRMDGRVLYATLRGHKKLKC